MCNRVSPDAYQENATVTSDIRYEMQFIKTAVLL